MARILELLGAAIIDADRITSECLGDRKIRLEIESSFGKQVLDDSGAIDRNVLADLVFTDEKKRQDLHDIIHPEIRKRMRGRLEQIRSRDRNVLVVIDAPLLLDSPFREDCDLLVMVEVPVEKRVERVMARRGWSETELNRRESAQASLSRKASAAQVVIDNSGSLEDLKKRVEEFYTRFYKRS